MEGEHGRGLWSEGYMLVPLGEGPSAHVPPLPHRGRPGRVPAQVEQCVLPCRGAGPPRPGTARVLTLAEPTPLPGSVQPLQRR